MSKEFDYDKIVGELQAKSRQTEHELAMQDILRFQLASYKMDKDYEGVIKVAYQILTLIRVGTLTMLVEPMIVTEIAEAHVKLGNIDFAKHWYRQAIEAWQTYRKTKKLKNPDDFLNEIAKLERKLARLEKKK